MKYVAPKSFLKSFTCPHCGVLALQNHYSRTENLQGSMVDPAGNAIRVSICVNCNQICIWYFDKLVFPVKGNAPMPNPDMPPDVKQDYEEASSIYYLSPRGAAALLRLGIQKLCLHLGGQGKNINDDISYLVKQGLPVTIQQSLDVVRVIGNNAVHPGQVTVEDPDEVQHLFTLTNLIVEYMISMPKKVETLYSSLPAGALKAIEKRDNA